MPQLDSSYFTPQLFWLFISFFVLLIGMRYVILPRLDKILKARGELLDKKLTQTQDLEAKAERLSAESKLRLKEAQKESKKLILQVKSDLNQEVVHAKHQLAEKNIHMLHETNDALKKEVDKIVQEIHKEKPALSVLVLEKILGYKVDKEDCKQILEKRIHDNKLD